MKKLMFLVPLFGILVALSSCREDLSDFSPADLPESVINFINTNYAGSQLDRVRLEDVCDSTVIKVELEGGSNSNVELYFSLAGDLLFTARDIAASALPASVRATIGAQFADYAIDSTGDDIERWEFSDNSVQYKVKLLPRSGTGAKLEVIFNANGGVICRDSSGNGNDDNGDDDNGGDDNGGDDNNNGNNNNGSLPNSITNYIRTNYAGYRIDSWHNEDLCDNRIVLKVELEDGPGPDVELYFTLAGEFLFSAKEIKTSDLPSVVRNAINANFSGYRIDDDKTERLQFADGSVQYKVELDRSSGSDIEVIFNANGGIVCRKS